MTRARDLFARITAGGYEGVMQMIADHVTEELFLDYKRSANDGNGANLDNRDKANLTKAISGFANSEGGVIIWGVDCRTDRANPEAGDVPQQALPVTRAVRFKSLLENAVSGATVPAHDGVQHEPLIGPNGSDGFVVTLIPKGNHPPYQTVPDLSFKMRAGSNFVSVPRSVLAGMFGQFPQPEIVPQFVVNTNAIRGVGSIQFDAGIALRNRGIGIASDVYLNIFVRGSGGTQADISFNTPDRNNWTHSLALGIMWTSMLKPEGRMPPEGFLMPVTMNIVLREPFDRDFKIDISAGAKGSPTMKATLHVPADELSRMFAEAMLRYGDGQPGFASFLSDRLLKVDGVDDA